MNAREQVTPGHVRLEAVDRMTMKTVQLRSLLATLVAAHGSGDLPDDHLSNSIWLASDLAGEILEAAVVLA